MPMLRTGVCPQAVALAGLGTLPFPRAPQGALVGNCSPQQNAFPAAPQPPGLREGAGALTFGPAHEKPSGTPATHHEAFAGLLALCFEHLWRLPRHEAGALLRAVSVSVGLGSVRFLSAAAISCCSINQSPDGAGHRLCHEVMAGQHLPSVAGFAFLSTQG